MTDTIEIPVVYKNETLVFSAQILAYGYTFKLSVDVNGTEVQFEPDEEGGYRAVLMASEQQAKIDKELVRAISDTLASGKDA